MSLNPNTINNPSFFYIKVGFKGAKLYRHVFTMKLYVAELPEAETLKAEKSVAEMSSTEYNMFHIIKLLLFPESWQTRVPDIFLVIGSL